MLVWTHLALVPCSTANPFSRETHPRRRGTNSRPLIRGSSPVSVPSPLLGGRTSESLGTQESRSLCLARKMLKKGRGTSSCSCVSGACAQGFDWSSFGLSKAGAPNGSRRLCVATLSLCQVSSSIYCSDFRFCGSSVTRSIAHSRDYLARSSPPPPPPCLFRRPSLLYFVTP